jgi:hypothetical protein
MRRPRVSLPASCLVAVIVSREPAEIAESRQDAEVGRSLGQQVKRGSAIMRPRCLGSFDHQAYHTRQRQPPESARCRRITYSRSNFAVVIIQQYRLMPACTAGVSEGRVHNVGEWCYSGGLGAGGSI